VKGKDLEANIDGKGNDKNKNEVKEILNYIYSEGHNEYIWLRLVTDKINFCCFQFQKPLRTHNASFRTCQVKFI
jgi:hypothetical protein